MPKQPTHALSFSNVATKDAVDNMSASCSQPLENITPLLIQPRFVESQPMHTQALNKVRRLARL